MIKDYKSVVLIALRDIAEYQKEKYKNKTKLFFTENVVTARRLHTKETFKLNSQLGLHSINKTHKEIMNKS